MERHLEETLGLAVASADFNLIPAAVRWTYEGTPIQVRALNEGGSFIAEVRATVRGLALELAHARAWLTRHHAAA